MCDHDNFVLIDYKMHIIHEWLTLTTVFGTWKKNTIVLYLIENDNNFTNNSFLIKHEKTKNTLINSNNNSEYI